MPDTGTANARTEFRVIFQGEPLPRESAILIDNAIQGAVLEALVQLGIAGNYRASPITAEPASATPAVDPIHIILGLIFGEAES